LKEWFPRKIERRVGERRIYVCLRSDQILKRNRNVMSAENLFLAVDHMSKNRKILIETQKIGHNWFMGWAFYISVLSFCVRGT